MIEDEFDKLLEKEWTEEEKGLIEKIKGGLLYYKRLIPKSLMNDVVAALQMCNKLKDQLQNLKENLLQDEQKI
jgi:hypothetical protein